MISSDGLIEEAAFVVGLVCGSFLNVCIVRLPQGLSVSQPGSRCTACAAPVRWYDNVPVLSWLVLRSRCRDCRAPISPQYPLVELATAVWFAITISPLAKMFFQVQPVLSHSLDNWPSTTIGVTAMALLGFLLIGLMVMDWRTGLLPDAFTLGGIAAALFLVCGEAIFLGPGEGQVVLNSSKQLRLRSPGSFAAQGNVFLTGPESLIFGRVAAVCGVALLLLAIRWLYKATRKQEGMGLGDVKMLAMIAAFVGFWPAIVALFAGVLAASLYSITLLAWGRAETRTRIAFGSFLALGGLLAARFGESLVSWYSNLLR